MGKYGTLKIPTTLYTLYFLFFLADINTLQPKLCYIEPKLGSEREYLYTRYHSSLFYYYPTSLIFYKIFIEITYKLSYLKA